MAKRGAWQVDRDGAGGGGDDGCADTKRALVERGATDMSVVLGEHVMCLIMSFLPRFARIVQLDCNERPRSVRKVVRRVCKRWWARCYDQWVDPPSAYILALTAGNEAHANRLWAMRREQIGTISVDATSLEMFRSAASGNVLRHIAILFDELQVPKRHSACENVEAALQGAARGGHIDTFRYIMRKYKRYFEPNRIFSQWYDKYDATLTCRNSWSMAICHGHVAMVRYFVEKHLSDAVNYEHQLALGVVLAALSKQFAVVDYLWFVGNYTGLSALHYLYFFTKHCFQFNRLVFNERFFAALLPQSTLAQRHHLLLQFAREARSGVNYSHAMLLILATVTDRRIRLAVLQLAVQNQNDERQQYLGVVDALKEHAFDTLRVANMVLHYAATRGHAPLIKYMLQHDQSDKLLIQAGARALHVACQHGHLQVVKALLADGRIDPRANNNLALLSAQRHERHAVVAVLVRAQHLPVRM